MTQTIDLKPPPTIIKTTQGDTIEVNVTVEDDAGEVMPIDDMEFEGGMLGDDLTSYAAFAFGDVEDDGSITGTVEDDASALLPAQGYDYAVRMVGPGVGTKTVSAGRIVLKAKVKAP